MSPDLIDPSGIPQFTGDVEQLGLDAVALGAEASVFRLSGANVHSTFQGLSAFYAAPEADQLFATTAPVATKSDAFADDLEKVGAALSAYQDEIRPLVTKLKSLQERATTFRADIAGDDHWRENNDNVSLNNDLVHDVNTTTAAFWQAEITCHNKITALVSGTTLIMEDGAAKRWLNRDQSLYGFTADVLNQSEDLPWGKTVEKERHGLDWLGNQIWEFGKGFVVDGVWGTIKGLGTLVGFDGLDAMGQAWDGLGKLATGIVISATPLAAAYWLAPDDKLPAYIRDSRNAMKETGKALVAYDQWGKNPARASGAVTFNVLTTVFTGGAGAAAKGGAAARTIAILGKAGTLVDPITYIGKAAKFGTVKVANLFTSLKNVHAGAYTDVITGVGKVQPDGSILKTADNVPVVVGNHIEWPDGTRLNLDDGSVIKADGTKAAAHVELSAADRAMLENNLAHREPSLIGAGDNATAHVGEATHVGEHATAPEHGGHASGGDHATGGAGGEGGHVPTQHGGPGPGPGPGGGHDGQAPRGHEPQPSPKEITQRQVERANNDPSWFKKHFRSNGYRRVSKADGGYGQRLPQLVPDPYRPGKWISASDMPPAVAEKYLHPDPVLGHRSAVGADALRHLDEQATERHNAIAADRVAEKQLAAAEKAYAAHPTQDLADAMAHADATHSPLHGDMGRQSEMFGEDVAEHHAIPEHYPGATRLDDGALGNNRFDQVYKTADGRYVVVEAKGSEKASLGVRKGHTGKLVTQGTREYFETILKEMDKRAARTGDEAEEALADELRTALKQGKVDYVLVKAQSNGAKYSGYQMKQFDVTP
ncbi:hypothetical protein HEP87_11435 [Streptomyces sp. S1D4-11]|nr:hypothetical protein [Streptomyces sp. S1D4-11]QIY94517.1 hypothetical protein HEP87_11435 [Streptomyces sp. S1D4-11]